METTHNKKEQTAATWNQMDESQMNSVKWKTISEGYILYASIYDILEKAKL